MTTPFTGAGFSTDPVYMIQKYLTTAGGHLGGHINDKIRLELTALGVSNSVTVLNNFLKQYSETNPLPQNIDDFVAALVAFIPGFAASPQGDALKTTIRTTIRDKLALEGQLASALLDPALASHSATFFDDMYDQAFDKFLQEFHYTGTTDNGTNPFQALSGDIIVDYNYFDARFDDFFVRFATIDPDIFPPNNFSEIFAAFFGTGNPAYVSYLANYIKNILYPTSGNAEAFLPKENIGEWLKKVQESYSLALTGTPGLQSPIEDSIKKTIIIDTIIQLIIRMIGTLQKVAAVQSNRLRILTNWQSAYTNLFTQIPTFTQGDGSIFGRPSSGPGSLTSKDEGQKARDQANNFNQTMAETVRSRRTVVQDDAKVLQSNINQSNDSANDQASTATALIQTLSTLLGAIYR